MYFISRLGVRTPGWTRAAAGCSILFLLIFFMSLCVFSMLPRF